MISQNQVKWTIISVVLIRIFDSELIFYPIPEILKRFFLIVYLLHRKEVIHPHVLVGIPCYDFTPVTDPTLIGPLLKG